MDLLEEGRCGGVTPPKEKSRKGSQFTQLGGPGMLELWNLLNIIIVLFVETPRKFITIKEYSETLRSKKV